MPGYDDNATSTWTCSCGKANVGKFCVLCGAPRPAVSTPKNTVANENRETPVPSLTKWVCTCGESNTGKFCVKCGALRPAQEAEAQKEEARKASEEVAARQTAGTKSAQETSLGKAGEEKATQEAAARQAVKARAVQEEAASKTEAEGAVRQANQEVTSVSSEETDDNKGMMKKAAIGVAVLLLLIGAYFMFGRKKETQPTPEPTKIEAKGKAEKPMDPAAKAEKLKEYAEMMKAANAEKKHDAVTNEKIVFLVDNVKRNGNDLVVSGYFYNGKKNRRITSVKSIQLDILLRDMDKELLNEKNIKYEKAFVGISIDPLQDSQLVSVDLPGKAPAAEFNNYVISVHDVHWEAVGR